MFLHTAMCLTLDWTLNPAICILKWFDVSNLTFNFSYFRHLLKMKDVLLLFVYISPCLIFGMLNISGGSFQKDKFLDINPMLVFGNIGPKQCIKECMLHYGCNAVNYDSINLNCELLAFTSPNDTLLYWKGKHFSEINESVQVNKVLTDFWKWNIKIRECTSLMHSFHSLAGFWFLLQPYLFTQLHIICIGFSILTYTGLYGKPTAS